MKIVRAMKVVARLQGDVGDLKRRMDKCLNALEGNEFEEDYKELNTSFLDKTKRLIDLKTKIMVSNINNSKFQTIIELGELKSRIEFLRELSPKNGEIQNDYRDTNQVYKSQMETKEKLDLINTCQTKINNLTDELDDFNAKTDV